MAGTHKNDSQVKGFATTPQAAFDKLRERELKKKVQRGELFSLLQQLEASLMGKIMFLSEKLGTNDAEFGAWIEAKRAEVNAKTVIVGSDSDPNDVHTVEIVDGPLAGGIGIGGGN